MFESIFVALLYLLQPNICSVTIYSLILFNVTAVNFRRDPEGRRIEMLRLSFTAFTVWWLSAEAAMLAVFFSKENHQSGTF